MIIRILGILDILAGILFWLFSFFHIIPSTLILILAFYLLAKGVFFFTSKDIASIIDVICAGIFFLALSFMIPKFLVVLVSIFLMQKGVLSLLS